MKIVNQHAGSDKYGLCQMCGKRVSEVHTLYYNNGNSSKWGHLECIQEFMNEPGQIMRHNEVTP